MLLSPMRQSNGDPSFVETTIDVVSTQWDHALL